MKLKGDKNKARAERIDRTLEFYKHVALGESGPVTEDEVTDLLSDLHHYCQRENIDIEDRLSSAEMHYAAERGGKE